MAHHHYLKCLLCDMLNLDEYLLIEYAQQGLVCHFIGVNLSSAFQPLLDMDGKTVGHEALLRTTATDSGQLSPMAAFNPVLRARHLVQLDRLVRTTC